jgi:hypothetical protein
LNNPDENPDAESAELELVEPQFVKRQGAFSPGEKALVLALIRSGTPRNELARKTGRNGSTITRLAQAEGLSFDRGRVTAPAREARASDLSLRRLAIAQKMADHLERLIDELHSPLNVRRINTRSGEVQVLKLREPDPAGKRDLAIAAGIISDKLSAILSVVAPQEGRAAVIALVAMLKQANGTEDNEAARNQSIDQ